MGSYSRIQCERINSMRIDIEHILLELQGLPEYEEQLSLQVTKDNVGGEGRLTKLVNTEQDFNVYAYDLPYTNSVLDSLGMYRSRLMKLAPKSCYTYHRDPTQRMHIPLLTNENNFFVIDDVVSRYPADGSHYLVDTRKKHTFVNASIEYRLHIVGCVDS